MRRKIAPKTNFNNIPSKYFLTKLYKDEIITTLRIVKKKTH